MILVGINCNWSCLLYSIRVELTNNTQEHRNYFIGGPMKKLIIIPAYNEADSIQKVVENLTLYYQAYDFIVINDCSIDNTVEILSQENVQYLDLSYNLGIGGAVQTGYIYAMKNGYDVAIQMDGDGQHDPQFLDALITPIENGQADVCIGSRFVECGGFQSSGIRRVGIRFLSLLIYICTGKRIKDVTSGFRAVNKRMIEFYAKNYPQDYPEPEAIVMAIRNHAKVEEVPVVMHERENGSSSITLKKSIYYMIKVSLALLLANAVGKRGKDNT